jgi:hypothetical protein
MPSDLWSEVRDWRASKHEEEGLEGTGKLIAKKLKNEIELDL